MDQYRRQPAGDTDSRKAPRLFLGAFLRLARKHDGVKYLPMIRLTPIVLLVFSNVFMTYAWYGHLKDLRTKPLLLVIIISWCIAFFEYCLQVPANRWGSSIYSLPQLKVIQEVLTMAVFAGFCTFYMKQQLTWDYLWASLCLAGAAFFMFRHLGV